MIRRDRLLPRMTDKIVLDLPHRVFRLGFTDLKVLSFEVSHVMVAAAIPNQLLKTLVDI